MWLFNHRESEGKVRARESNVDYEVDLATGAIVPIIPIGKPIPKKVVDAISAEVAVFKQALATHTKYLNPDQRIVL